MAIITEPDGVRVVWGGGVGGHVNQTEQRVQQRAACRCSVHVQTRMSAMVMNREGELSIINE